MSIINPFVHEFYIDLQNGTTQQREKKPLSQGDAYADKVVVHVQDGGNEVSLAGVGVSAKVIRYDGQTVPIVGHVENGAACVVLDAACYAKPGDVRVSVALSVGEMVQTVLVLSMSVETSETSIIADNGVVSDLTEILTALADMRSATDAANDAAERANSAAKRAEDAAERAESAGGGGGGGDLPTASETVKGGVRVGAGLRMDGDVLIAEVRKEDVDKLSKEIEELKESGAGGVTDAVRYTEQTLTDEQKTQARMNLWQQVPSENLFNKETVVVGEYLAPTGEAVASANLRYAFVPLAGAGTYACAVPGSKLGFGNGNYKKIPIYDVGKNYLMTIEGTSNDTTSAVDNKVIFVVSDAGISNGAAYMGFNIEKTMLDSVMVVKAGSYPERYIPYSPTLGIPEFGISVESVKAFEVNPLYGKIATFTGDSICEARENNGGGYATLIGNRNAMVVENLGVSGGRITVGTEKFCITESVNSMRTDADYVILEGGVNDAAANNLGEISDNFNAMLDTATFCGAFEQMVKNAITRFPGKKIGYIAVHRLKQWAPDDYNTNFPNTGYYEAAINICKKWGVPVCDLTTNCPSLYEIDSLKQAYTTNADGWHPNEEGYLKYYVPKIEAWMKTL